MADDTKYDLGPEDYAGPLLGDDETEYLEDPAWADYKYDRLSPETFDIDKYNQLAYRQALKDADDSIYGKLAGIGDNVLAAKGMGIQSGSWLSRINELNAEKREAHQNAAYKALAQTIVAQQQKFNQALAAGKMNLDVFAHSTDANLRRLGVHVDAAKLAGALDAVKKGDYEQFNKIVKVWADAMVSIRNSQAERENREAIEEMAGQTSINIARGQAETAASRTNVEAANARELQRMASRAAANADIRKINAATEAENARARSYRKGYKNQLIAEAARRGAPVAIRGLQKGARWVNKKVGAHNQRVRTRRARRK
jgi:hypothetical protein